ncbi:hypothetical protein CTI12_AA141620 [Artemisia annua]|uniref:ATP-dependent DNA helicase n=1 Tax=Artemisia annua TaxID=35608 RepID=A0A2U1PK79_ARTAN|nr:hypothetical protein CTI12_AA141620 [Artemisia annua]
MAHYHFQTQTRYPKTPTPMATRIVKRIHSCAFKCCRAWDFLFLKGTYTAFSDKVFVGKVIVFGGDFGQILPSYLWNHCTVPKLTENMRLRVGCNPGDAKQIKDFAEWILSICDGIIGSTKDGTAMVEFPEEMLYKLCGRWCTYTTFCDKVFVGKVIVFGGDFGQILPSYLWNHCTVPKLTENMRLRVGCNHGDAKQIKDFAEWILSICDGTIGSTKDGTAKVEFPEEMLYKL